MKAAFVVALAFKSVSAVDKLKSSINGVVVSPAEISADSKGLQVKIDEQASRSALSANSLNSEKSSSNNFLRSLYTLSSAYGSDQSVCNEITSNGCLTQSLTINSLTFITGKPAYCAIANAYSAYTCSSGSTLYIQDIYDNSATTCFQVTNTPVSFCLPDQYKSDPSITGFFGATPVTQSSCIMQGNTYPVTPGQGSCAPAAKCFSGADTVTLESGAKKALSEVRVGDKILSADAAGKLSFSDVVFLPHAANEEAATFYAVTTAGGKTVKATEMHLLTTCSGALAYAGSLKQGDCLRTADGDEAVTAIKTEEGKGIYTVVTQNEFPVISGVVASPFAVTHGIVNAFYNIHRALYKIAPVITKSAAVASANALIGAAAVVAVGLFESGSK